MGLEAATKALLDAGITYDEVGTAFVGYCYGDSTSGQRALYNLGLTHIPITNVNNNCSTGATALYQANNAVKFGQVDCALALGFEKMQPGSRIWRSMSGRITVQGHQGCSIMERKNTL